MEHAGKGSGANLGQLNRGLGRCSSRRGDDTVILSSLSHFGDFNAWELTQQYLSAIDSGRIGTERYAEQTFIGIYFNVPLFVPKKQNSPVVLVGIGSVESALYNSAGH